MSKEPIDVDLVGKIGDDGGIGNYVTKLYHGLKDTEIRMNSISYEQGFPFLEPLFQNFLETSELLYRSDADIVHFTDQEQVSGLFWVPEKYLQDVVVTVHDISPYLNNYAGPVSRTISKFYVRSLEKAGGIIAISEFTKSKLVENLDIPEEKIEVVYQGIDTDHFRPREENQEILEKYGIERPYVVYVGSEINRKNIRGNLEKFKELKEKYSELTLVKVGGAGRKKYRDKTKKHIEELGLEDDVVFTGFVDEEDLPYLYSMAEANLLFSHYEGFGRSALEAEACGTPTLTHDKPPMNEYLPEDRYTNYDLNADRETVNMPSWRNTVRETVETYEKLQDVN